MDKRFSKLVQWVAQVLKQNAVTLVPLSGDASSRRYYRFHQNSVSYLAVDSPPDKENNLAFVKLTAFFTQLGVLVPKLYQQDLIEGFFLISDFGDDLYLKKLNLQSADRLYQEAIHALIKIQSTPVETLHFLPQFNGKFIERELALFIDWFIKWELDISLSSSEASLLNHTFENLANQIESQPRVLVHRDYHSRNLMWLDSQEVGILDYQDSVVGPVSYDVVSLFRDAYIEWQHESVRKWVLYYYKSALKNGILPPELTLDEFFRWFDWMGIQRHLKVVGIFSRLCHRDGKTNYRYDMPRVLQYILQVTEHYEEWGEFREWLQQKTRHYIARVSQ